MRAMVLEKDNQTLPVITQPEQVFLTSDDLDRFLKLRKQLKERSTHEMRERKVKAFLSRWDKISDPHFSLLKKEIDQRSSLYGKSLVLAAWLTSILRSVERTIEG